VNKLALFVFNGDPMCFIHVLLNGLEWHRQGAQVQIIMEGAATKLLPELTEAKHPLHRLWVQAKEADLIGGVCHACATKMGTADAAQQQQLELLAEMSGHPAMARYRAEGYELITF
jgi:hypothetical protein